MASLTTMMNWYAATADTVEKECVDCGDLFSVPTQNAGRKDRCNSCAMIHDAERHHVEQLPPEFKLALAVIKQTRNDLKFKRKCEDGLDPREFIQNNGIQLWLRSLGIGVRPSMNKQITRMTR